MSPKQSTILRELRTADTITLDRACELIGQDLYANAKFHVGNVLGNMVKRGYLVRIKPGLFRAPHLHEVTRKP